MFYNIKSIYCDPIYKGHLSLLVGIVKFFFRNYQEFSLFADIYIYLW